MMKRKVIGTTVRTQTPKQACYPKRNDMMRKDRRKLSSSSKIMLWEEDQVAQVKSPRQGYSQTS